MSKYTTEVRYICESYADLPVSVGFDGVDDVLEQSWDKIFVTNAVVFDEQYRKVICKKILKHYYTNEIGQETVGLWKLYMNRKMEEILPFYNKLWESATLEFNPLYDVNYTKRGSNTGSSAGSTDSTENAHNEHSGNETENYTHEKSGSSSSSATEIGEEATNGSENRDIGTTSEGTGTSVRTEETEATSNRTSNSTDNTDQWMADTPQSYIENADINGFITNATKGSKETDTTENTTSSSSANNSENNTASFTETVDDDMTFSNSKQSTITNSDSKEYNDSDGFSGSKVISTENTNNKQVSSSTSANTTEEFVETVQGYMGGRSSSKLLQEYRDTLLNIDLMFIEEFSGLFFGLW